MAFKPMSVPRAASAVLALLLLGLSLWLLFDFARLDLARPEWLPNEPSNNNNNNNNNNDDAAAVANPLTQTQTPPPPPSKEDELDHAASSAEIELLEKLAQHAIDHPIVPPYKPQFAEMGGRAQLLRLGMELQDRASDRNHKDRIAQCNERLAVSLFPFIVNPTTQASSSSSSSSSSVDTPLANLRRSFTDRVGIVIPTGTKTFRFACHLVVSLRRALHVRTPIQIVYAGESDLPEPQRRALASLSPDDEITFLDVLTALDDDAMMGLAHGGGWAVKAFAALAAPFREVILLDADAVFVQHPETLLRWNAYAETGVLLFHDRLLWQHGFAARHEWWRSQVGLRPSATLRHSKVWAEDYAEEGDSGVVVLDKGRPGVLAGLLHVAWQNAKPVRDEVTYKITYGDKESWWFGFELAGTPFAFEEHYGGIAGWKQPVGGEGQQPQLEGVCSFVIAHVDEADRLVWYNGGLLKNKMTQPTVFEVPTHWMIDGRWIKGGRKQDMSCMVETVARPLTEEEMEVLRQSIEVAQQVDADLDLAPQEG